MDQRRLVLISLAAVAVLITVSACSTSFIAYSNNMFNAKRFLEYGQYREARADFVRAAEARRTAEAFAFAATAAYKLNDLPAAEQYIDDAARLDGRTDFYMRILGYRALILLREGRQDEGLNALERYAYAMSNTYPMTSTARVQVMAQTGQVNLPLLEGLIDEAVNSYEYDLAQARESRTGYFANRYGGAFDDFPRR